MIATPATTAVVTLLCYPKDEIPPTYRLLQHTAARRNIEILEFGLGHPYVNSVHAKVTSLRQCILQAVPARFTHILYVDARDVLFAGGLEEICENYNDIGHPIVMAGESRCYPEGMPEEYLERFFNHDFGMNFHNAGTFMGERRSLMASLKLIQHLHEQVIQNKWPTGFQVHANNDQYLWQLASHENFVPLTIDYGCKIFCNLPLCPYEKQDMSRDRFALTNGSTPAVLHFSGATANAMGPWAHHFGLIPKNLLTHHKVS